jgi:hypothetical protein
MPAVTQKAVVVDGYRELLRAFSVADKTLSKELRSGLRDAAEPVRSDSEALAVARIPNIGLPWSRMRVGITTRSVYIAPRQRGARGRSTRKRPNLAGLLLGRAMEPALDANIASVSESVDDVLATVGRAWERA